MEEKTNEENNEMYVMENLRDYYKLKRKYEKNYHQKYLYPIIKIKASKTTKKKMFQNLPKPQCINCKQNVGTIFERKYYEEYNDKSDVIVFTAKCGDILNPCDLNIEIHRSARESYTSMIDEIKEKINNTQLDIILLKNKTLFLNNKNKNDEYLNLFEELSRKIKEEYSILTKLIEENIFINDNPDENDKLNNLIASFNQIDILNFKKKINEYITKGDEDSLKNAIKNYQDDIYTKIKQIRELKYKTMYVLYDSINKIYLLNQDKHSYDGKHFYDPYVDEVISFIKGHKLNKESTTLNLNNDKNDNSIKNENNLKSETKTKSVKTNKTKTLKNSLIEGKLSKPKTLKKRLVISNQLNQDDNVNDGGDEESKEDQIKKETKLIDTEIIFKPSTIENIDNVNNNSTRKIIRKKRIIVNDDENEDDNNNANNKEIKGGSSNETNEEQNYNQNIEEQSIGKIKKYNKNIMINQAN